MRAKCCIWIGCLGLIMLAGCSSKKYADYKQVYEEYITATEAHVTVMEKADSAQAVAQAMNTFADDMVKLHPQMKAMADKYPELKDAEQMPEELKELQSRAQEAGFKMGNTTRKLMPYMQDPEVQKALMRFQQAMQGSAQ